MKALKLVFAAACVLPALAFAQETRPYTPGPVTAVTFVKVKPGHFDEYIKHLGGLYRQQMEAFKKAGLVVDYKVFSTTARSPADADLILTVTYPNMAALDKNQEFDDLGRQVAGSFASQNKAFADRGAIREVLGGILTREVVLK